MFEDLHADAFGIFRHLVVPEADDAKTLAFEVPRSPVILRKVDAVLPAIDLDSEAMREANEIDDVMIDRLLTAELIAR